MSDVDPAQPAGVPPAVEVAPEPEPQVPIPDAAPAPSSPDLYDEGFKAGYQAGYQDGARDHTPPPAVNPPAELETMADPPVEVEGYRSAYRGPVGY